MKKKLISVLLALVLAVSVCALTMLSASAEETADTHSHCVCGENLTDAAALANHTCGEDLTWTPLTADCLASGTKGAFKASGNYYLTGDFSSNGEVQVPQGMQVNICLNGYTWTAKLGEVATFRCIGQLSICDCQGDGTITSTSTKQGGLVFMNNANNTTPETDGYTTLNIYGGNFIMTDDNYKGQGGLIQVGYSTKSATYFNLYGGSLSGGTAYRGGSVFITNALDVMNMYGGTISSGKNAPYGTTESVQNRGGNIYANGQFNMYGGVVTGGTYAEDETYPGTGGDIYVSGVGACSIDCQVGNLDISAYSSNKITLGDNFSCTGTITCNSPTAGLVKIATGNNLHQLDAVTTDPERSLLVAPGELTLVPADVHYVCRCGGAHYGSQWHSSCTPQQWTALTLEVLQGCQTTEDDGGSYVLPAGAYYLTGDLTTDKCIRISNGTNRTDIDLNGYTLTSAEGVSLTLRIRSNVHICDSSFDAAATDYVGRYDGLLSAGSTGQIMYVSTGATLNIWGGNVSAATSNIPFAVSGTVQIFDGVFTGTDRQSASTGGNITLYDSGNVTLYNGLITGGKAKYGGNVNVNNAKSTFTMKDGVIENGYAAAWGGNLYVKGTVNISGGIIRNGSTVLEGANTGYGGNILVDTPTADVSSGILRISGGQILDGKACTGGNIFTRGSMKLSGTGLISGGEAVLNHGGNIRVNGAASSLEVSGGTITLGVAESSGGNVFGYSSAPITVSGGEISYGQSTNHGGNINSNYTLTITGGTISNGNAGSNNGGNIYMDGSNSCLSMTGGTVKDGEAGRGGNIQLNGGNRVAHEIGGNAMVSGGKANSGSCGSIYLNSSTLTISGNATITGGWTKYDGGNIRNDSGTLTITGGTISDGAADSDGGNLYLNPQSTTEISGGTFTGGLAKAGNGGSIFNEGTLTITGGSFTNNAEAATAQSGGVIYTKGTMTVANATVSGGNASKSPSGGTLAVAGGTASITNSELTAGWGSRGTCINLANAGTILTVTDSVIKGRTENYGTSGFGTSCWIEGGTFKLVGDVQILGEGLDVLCQDLRFDTATTIDVSELDTQEPLGLRRQDQGDGLAVFAGDNADANVIAHLANQYAYYNEADQSFYLALSAVAAYDSQNQILASYNSWADALAADAAYYVMQTALDGGTISKDIVLNLNGQTVTNVTIPADVTVQLIDTATDDCQGEYGTLSVTEGSNAIENLINFNGKDYLVVFDSGAYSSHYYHVALTHVSLDAANDALGYKATLLGDEVVQGHVAAFGFNLWVSEDNIKTYSTTGKQEITLRLKNIMAAGGGEMDIHANAFVTFDVGGTETTDDYATTMKQTILAVNAGWDSYSDTQKAAVKALYNDYSAVMDSWFDAETVNNIQAWVPAEDGSAEA